MVDVGTCAGGWSRLDVPGGYVQGRLDHIGDDVGIPSDAFECWGMQLGDR